MYVRFSSVRCLQCDVSLIIFQDVYNMQLSNKPAEALAKKLVEGSHGAFELCAFASGGKKKVIVYRSHIKP